MADSKIYTFHLFAGAGGGILGDLLLGHVPIGAVEIEKYPREILFQRQKDGVLPRFPVWDDVTTFRPDNPECKDYFRFLKGNRDRLCIAGGFPCQDISLAGKGAGLEGGARSSLWFEMQRIIREVQPKYVFVENSPALIIRGLGRVLDGLSSMGYGFTYGVVGADDAGAPHYRKRFWLWGERTDVADADL